VDLKKEVMFTITRNFVRLALLITGILVLVSYAVGAIRMVSPMDLWGGIPNSWIPFILVFMGLAVTGFLVFTWFFLIQWAPEAVDSVVWPWQKYEHQFNEQNSEQNEQNSEQNEQTGLNTRINNSGGGFAKLLMAYLLFLIPSMFWLELTALHMEMKTTWTQVLVIGSLWLVCFGNILMILLALSAHRQKIAPHTIWPLIGTIFLGIQCIINDGIIWNIKFPW